MNRRKPQLDLAVIAVAHGEDRRTAVLRKAQSQAREALQAQLPLDLDDEARQRFSPFLDGYLIGYARQVALKHGSAPDAAMSGRASRFDPETGKTADARCEAGLLTGHLEALCGTRHLVLEAALCRKHADAAQVFLTACDNAADPMQSRAPTQSLRFTWQERAVIAAGFAYLRADSPERLQEGTGQE